MDFGEKRLTGKILLAPYRIFQKFPPRPFVAASETSSCWPLTVAGYLHDMGKVALLS